MVCLVRGFGQHYRQFIISYINENKIIIKYYETALTTDIDKAIVEYKDENRQEEIIVENIRSGSQKTF